MARCDRCGSYAYYRTDGSKRCQSCNFDSRRDKLEPSVLDEFGMLIVRMAKDPLNIKICKIATIGVAILLLYGFAITSNTLYNSIGLRILTYLFSIPLMMILVAPVIMIGVKFYRVITKA